MREGIFFFFFFYCFLLVIWHFQPLPKSSKEQWPLRITVKTANIYYWGLALCTASQGALRVKNRLQYKRPRLEPCVRKTPWRRKWQPTSAFLPGKPLGQRSRVGCSPRGCNEWDMTDSATKQHTRKNPQTCVSFPVLKLVKWINNKDLLCNTGNYIQYLIITYKGKESEKDYTYVSGSLDVIIRLYFRWDHAVYHTHRHPKDDIQAN